MADFITSALSSQPPKRRRKRKPKKPAKPYPEFPLFAHNNGLWAKKIRGHLFYFGPWRDSDAALAKYLEQKDELHAGRTPRQQPAEGFTIADLCNRFLTAKQLKVNRGELSPHSFRDYHATCKVMIEWFGRNRLVSDLAADDFMRLLASLTTLGPVARGNLVNRVRVVFKHAYESGSIDQLPRYGPDFKRPSKKELRLVRARKGPRMFEAAELQRILTAATQPLKAMILLGINCGLGNADCGRLPFAALDLDGGWLNYHREKTGIPRRAKFWPETVAALREAIAERPKPKEDGLEDRVFVTVRGGSWFKDTGDNPVSKEMAKLLKRLGIDGDRNFYCLRHGFETIAGDSRDQPAVDHVMGHARDDMASIYRERISDDRLVAVAQHVRNWLFGEQLGRV